MWIVALVFTGILVSFLIATFFFTPTFTVHQERTVLFLYPLLAGLSTYFLGGSALVEISSDIAAGTKLGVSATAGIAVFVLCYLYPPYFLRTPRMQETIDATRTILSQDPSLLRGSDESRRKALAADLVKNCRRWSQILIEVFDEAGRLWREQGEAAARQIIEKQQMDLDKLDYWGLDTRSPILKFLQGDPRYARFAGACAQFYQQALNIKQRVAQTIGRPDIADIPREVVRWQDDVEGMLRPVVSEFHHLTTRID